MTVTAATEEGRRPSQAASQKSDEARPLLVDSAKRGLDFSQTVFSMVNCFVGAGILTMPYAFRLAGYSGALFALLSVSTLTWFCAQLLGKAYDIAAELRLNVKDSDIGELAGAAFGPAGKVGIRWIFAIELWFCLETFLILIALNMHIATGQNHDAIVITAGLLGFASLWLPPSALAFGSALSVGCMMCGLLSLVIYGTSQSSAAPSKVEHRWDDTWALANAASICLYCLSGLPCLPTIRSEMKDTRQFYSAVSHAFGFAAIYYAAVGLLAYKFFSDDIKESFTINLSDAKNAASKLHGFPLLSTSAMACAAMFALKLQGGFPLYAAPILQPLGLADASGGMPDHKLVIGRAIFAIVSVAFAVCAKKQLALIAGMTGAVLTCSTSVIFPSAVYIALVQKSGISLLRPHVVVAGLTVVAGVAFAVFGTVQSYRRFVAAAHNSSVSDQAAVSAVVPHSVHAVAALFLIEY
eukprot:TRINITY_DN19976_c1_g1_i2.p1 TRINITY_DN19976_c1_g1~~TRINITY_DN19976_c1_g1_i2.p1  ORF type:complete len:468 (+),score=91.57 TRINITY_DN19976_c1_g1_i2:79-1482(+)